MVRLAPQKLGNLAKQIMLFHVASLLFMPVDFFLRRKFSVIIILYCMIEFLDKSGHLIVVFQAGRREFGVYVQGRCVAVFRSGKEALDHARFLSERPADGVVEHTSAQV
jgi:hypothetical protein